MNKIIYSEYSSEYYFIIALETSIQRSNFCM